MKINYNLTLDEILNCTGGKTVIAGDGTGPFVFNEIFTDSREDFSRNALFIAIKGKNFNGEDFVDSAFQRGARCAVVSWDFLEKFGLSKYSDKIIIAVENTVDALGNISKVYLNRFNLKKKIAITGSCGKTMTKEMSCHIISSKYGAEKILKNNYNYNNLIGVPKTILGLNAEHEYLILEIGTNKKGEIKKLSGIIEPDAGAIVNIGKSHLQEFINPEGVFEEKNELALSLKKDSYLIINADDEILSEKYEKIPDANMLSFGLGFKQTGRAADILCEKIDTDAESGAANIGISFKGKKYAAKVRFRGVHLIYDLLCALLVAYVCGIDAETGLKAMEDFVFPEGRMEVISGPSIGYILINDAYNSNPDSLKAALDFIKAHYSGKKKILVLGDMLELGDSSEAEHYNAGRNIAGYADFVFYKGDYAESFRKGLLEEGFPPDKLFPLKDKNTFRENFEKLDKKNSVVLIKGSRGNRLEEYFDEEMGCKKTILC